MSFSFDLGDIIALIALLISALAFFSTKILYRPKVCVSASSKGEELLVVLENMGISPIYVKSVDYEYNNLDSKQNILFFTDIMRSVHCETRTENRCSERYLMPGGYIILYSSTFSSQEDLENAWDKIGNITVSVNLGKILGKRNEKFDLSNAQFIFYNVIADEIANGEEKTEKFPVKTLTYKDDKKTRKIKIIKKRKLKCFSEK